MVVVNERGEIVWVNAQLEKTFGYQRAELLGQHVTKIIPEGFGEQLTADALRSSEDTLGEQIGAGVELSGRRKTCTEFPVEAMLSPLRSAEGWLVTAALRDISVRKGAETQLNAIVEALTRSNAELQAFTDLASHDLQEPLRKIRSFGERLGSGEHGLSAQGADYVMRMRSAATRMQALLQNLLSYSRVTAAAEPMLRTPLNDVLADVMADLEVTIDRSGALIEVGTLPEIDCDALQMGELFQNLITNAIKFRRETGLVRVRISSALDVDGHVSINIEDNGIGFDMAYAEKIFGMFQRLHGRDHYEGTGIGLAVCRRIAERHGGHITASSAPESGTRFTVVLPIATRQSEHVEVQGRATKTPSYPHG